MVGTRSQKRRNKRAKVIVVKKKVNKNKLSTFGIKNISVQNKKNKRNKGIKRSRRNNRKQNKPKLTQIVTEANADQSVQELESPQNIINQDEQNKEEQKKQDSDDSFILNSSSEDSQPWNVKVEERKEEPLQTQEQKLDQTTNNKDLAEKTRRVKRRPGRPKGSRNRILSSEDMERKMNKHSKVRGRPRKYPKLDDIIENEISTLGNVGELKNAQFKDPAPLSIELATKINKQKNQGNIEFIEDHQFDVLYGQLGLDEPLRIVDHKLAFFNKWETSKVTLDVFYEIEFNLSEEQTLLKNNFFRKEDIYKHDKYILKSYIMEHKELYPEWRLIHQKQENQSQKNELIKHEKIIQREQEQVFISEDEIQLQKSKLDPKP